MVIFRKRGIKLLDVSAKLLAILAAERPSLSDGDILLEHG